MVEASRREHEVWTCQIDHLGLGTLTPVAAAQLTLCARPDAARRSRRGAVPSRWRVRHGADAQGSAGRRDLHATWILSRPRQDAAGQRPRGLRELNEHLAVLRFPELTPPTLVTRDARRLASFQREQGGAIVVKPVDGFGGLGVFLVKDGDPNASSIFETSTGAGTRWTMAQRYLPEAVDGDKRILLVDGEPVGAVLRVPGKNEARGNLHVGGRAVKAELDSDDRAIIAAITPTLRHFGQILVGIDVIGGRLTEINITSPTGVRHIEALDGRNVAGDVLDRLERAALARAGAAA
jgi:glutathione synthase